MQLVSTVNKRCDSVLRLVHIYSDRYGSSDRLPGAPLLSSVRYVSAAVVRLCLSLVSAAPLLDTLAWTRLASLSGARLSVPSSKYQVRCLYFFKACRIYLRAALF